MTVCEPSRGSASVRAESALTGSASPPPTSSPSPTRRLGERLVPERSMRCSAGSRPRARPRRSGRTQSGPESAAGTLTSFVTRASPIGGRLAARRRSDRRADPEDERKGAERRPLAGALAAGEVLAAPLAPRAAQPTLPFRAACTAAPTMSRPRLANVLLEDLVEGVLARCEVGGLPLLRVTQRPHEPVGAVALQGRVVWPSSSVSAGRMRAHSLARPRSRAPRRGRPGAQQHRRRHAQATVGSAPRTSTLGAMGKYERPRQPVRSGCREQHFGFASVESNGPVNFNK